MVFRSRPAVRRLALVAGLSTAIAGLTGTTAQPVHAIQALRALQAEGSILYADHPHAVPGSYVVIMRDGAPTVSPGGRVSFVYTAALKGFAVETTERQARSLAADPRVAYVAQNLTVALAQDVGPDVFVQPDPPSWGLDRIDERSLPLDAKYHYPNTAPRISAYVIDTGIRYTHQEFGGRAVLGVDTVGDGQQGNDCHGHGTFMAGTAGGRTVGVAKKVELVSVRVLNCAGSGTFAQVIAGVDWVTRDALTGRRLGVANMSLGGGFYQPLNDAVTASIEANVHYSVAAGGSGSSACSFSPASTPRATTVGATDITDNRALFSNIGPCLDLFAPGVGITSAWAAADDAYVTISGTSPATAHAAGTAALWRQRFPSDDADGVARALTRNATPGVVGNPGVGSPNLLLFMGMIPM